MYAALKLRTYEPLRSNAHGHGKESTTKGATPASPPRREKKSKLGRSKTASPLEKDPTVASRAALRSPYIATPFSIDAAHGPPNHAKAAVQSGVATAPAADAGLPTVLSSSFNFPKQGGAVWVEHPGTPSGVSFFDDGQNLSAGLLGTQQSRPRFPHIGKKTAGK
uniref:Uncharacterized protein n=1 Tax=Palpitomonas bilix TaxID=652834 RepID=A0A7S3DID2_9EUKA|mmetsp:Transcript_39149/g.100277  ORF Transcript_39149/g.100277 Transcript_39149/m.100277 type:complete len:165 (+) Transcript_39149:46-540(+)